MERLRAFQNMQGVYFQKSSVYRLIGARRCSVADHSFHRLNQKRVQSYVCPLSLNHQKPSHMIRET